MLLVFTDGSKKDGATGYAYQGIYLGRAVFSLAVPFGGSKSSSFDAEMFALAHASRTMLTWLLAHPHVSTVRMFSDASSALKVILSGTPHPAQTASINFRTNFHALFSSLPPFASSLTGPGHKGTIGMKGVDKLAKQAASSAAGTRHGTLVSYTSRAFPSTSLRRELLLDGANTADGLCLAL